MKKIALFVSVLLLAGSLFAAAPEFTAKPGISGAATLTFGFGLDASHFGIASSAESDITLGLIAEASDEKGGKDGEEVYGWIKLADFDMSIDSDNTFWGVTSATDATAKKYASFVTVDAPDVSAKLFLGPVFINILSSDNGSNDMAGNFKAMAQTAAVTGASQDLNDDNNDFSIGLKDTSIVAVDLGMSTEGDWLTNTTDDLAFFATVGLKAVPDLTLTVNFNYATNAADFGLGAKVGYGITIAEGYKLTPTVGFEMLGTDYQLSANVLFAVPGKGLDDDDTFANDIDYSAGLELNFAMDDEGNMDLGAYFYDADLFPVVNVLAGFEMADMTALGLGLKVTADLGVIDPWATFKYADLGTDIIKLEVGVDITAITNTTFTLKYASGDNITTAGNLGAITFATKIAY